MTKCLEVAIVAAVLACASASSLDAQDLQAKLTAAKQAATLNQQALRSYSWVETTEVSLKGEVKNTKVDLCRYGPDGKVQRSPVVEPPAAERKRGLRGKVIAKKTGELKEEMESAAALVHQYVPPTPDLMQAVMSAGTASISQAGPGFAALTFPAYLKKGDALTLAFESQMKILRAIAVDTWLDEPEDAVTLKVTMQTLPGGISAPDTIVLGLTKRQLAVTITKSNYQQIVQ